MQNVYNIIIPYAPLMYNIKFIPIPNLPIRCIYVRNFEMLLEHLAKKFFNVKERWNSNKHDAIDAFN